MQLYSTQSISSSLNIPDLPAPLRKQAALGWGPFLQQSGLWSAAAGHSLGSALLKGSVGREESPGASALSHHPCRSHHQTNFSSLFWKRVMVAGLGWALLWVLLAAAEQTVAAYSAPQRGCWGVLSVRQQQRCAGGQPPGQRRARPDHEPAFGM